MDIILQVPDSLIVSGPLWAGPLHCADYLKEMRNLAREWGWLGDGSKNDLDKLLNRMIDESDPGLSFGYIELDEVCTVCLFYSRSWENYVN